jgi:hypothetical protein
MKRVLLASALAAMTLAAPAAAVTGTLTINPITAAWSDVTGTTPTFSGTNTSPTIRWGTSTGSGRSGYNFSSAAVPLDVNYVVDGAGETFDLGTFTHFNNPITGGSITGARLTITYGVSVNGGAVTNYSSVFRLLHDETPNGSDPCAFGGANDQGVNVNGCADRVRIGLLAGASESFEIDGIEYFLDIDGFFANNTLVNQFLTVERKDNQAVLRGAIVAASALGPGGVPEPGTWAMMLLGFGAVGIAARRRSAVVAA